MSGPAPERAWERVLGRPSVWVLLITASVAVPTLLRPKPMVLPVLGSVPALALTDQEGRAFARSALEGRVTIANFIFTNCPTICPMLTQKAKGLQERTAGTGVRLVSFSVDPEVDTPAVLKAFGTRFGADFSRWSFVTGPKEAIERAVVDGFKVGLSRERRAAPATEPDVWDIVHGEHFVLIDRDGRIRGYYRNEPAILDKLVRDATALDGAR